MCLISRVPVWLSMCCLLDHLAWLSFWLIKSLQFCTVLLLNVLAEFETGFRSFLFQNFSVFAIRNIICKKTKQNKKKNKPSFDFYSEKNHRLVGSSKNSTESPITFTQLLPVVTSYLTLVQYENLENNMVRYC